MSSRYALDSLLWIVVLALAGQIIGMVRHFVRNKRGSKS